jgi:hypothetical protein
MAKTFFIPLRKLLQSFIELDVDQIAFDIAQTNNFKRLVIQLNTEGKPTSQLFELGEDSEGRDLGEYSPFTKELKKLKGQRIDHITLKDTGDFYASFIVRPFKGGFTIDADPIKDDTNLFREYGEDILGLNDDNLQIIINFYKDAILESLEQIKAA